MFKKDGNNEIKSTSHSKYRCQYHIVFAPKYRRKEIRMGKDICFLGSNDVLLKPSSREWRNHFYIHRRYADGKHYLLSKTMDEEDYATLYELYYDGVNAPKLKKQQK